MIVPMKKVCLMVQEKSRVQALNKLREVGVVHLENKDAPLDVNSNAIKLKTKVEDALGLISEYKTPKKKKPEIDLNDKRPAHERRKKPIGLHRGRRATDIFGTDIEAPYSLDAVRAPRRPYLPDLMIDMGEERKYIKEKNSALNREVNRIEGWGDFDPSIVKEIIEYGIPIYFYELTQDVFNQLDKDVRYIRVKGDKSIIRIIVFEKALPGITPFQIPETRLFEYQNQLETNKVELQIIESKIKSFADRRPSLNKEMEKVQNDLEFETAVSGMNGVENIPQEHGLSWLSGFIPYNELNNLKKAASENNWALTVYDPSAEDQPPTKLVGNSLARLLHPLLSLLGTIPGYKEFDISASYLFFFSIFFAMILGDAGYGALLFVIAAIIGISGLIKNKKIPDVAKLLMLLNFCTVIWGAINGSWFAIPRENLPHILSLLIIPQFNNVGPVVEFPLFLQNIFKLPAEIPVDEFKTQWNIQFLCFSLAVIQLVYARGKRILSEIRSLTAVAQFGMLIMMLGLYFLVLNMLLGMELPSFAIVFIGTGVFLNLIFAEQNGGNFFKNVGKGLGNSFQLFLKSVSCFADIISYIRLFAVGLAGSIIAQIVNDLAIPADGLGSFGIMFILKLLIAVTIIAIGHGLNLVLTALSVIVHGVRLNLLEYAGNHLEMDWSGYLYRPFATKQKKE